MIVIYLFTLGNSNDQACKEIQSSNVKKKDSIYTENLRTNESIGNESTFNKSDRLHTSSGYFNSGESSDSTSKSIKNDSVGLNNNIHSESTFESTSDILNENISTNDLSAELLSDILSDISFDTDGNSIKSENPDIENIENISFPSTHLIADSELITYEKIFNQPNETYSSNTEWLTDISGLSSSEEYFTCPDTNSKQHNFNGKSDKIDVQLEDVTNNMSMTSFYDSMRYLFVYLFLFKL